jgi:hypothetical protein
MATNAEINALGQMRFDIPHLRMVEAGVRYDFDALAYMVVGDRGYVVKGFEIITAAVGDEVSSVTIKVAGSKVIHPLASEAGSIFAVPTNRAVEVLNPQTNSRMQSSCQPSSTNYIGIDLKRSADATTADIVQFLEPDTNTEFPQKLPLRRTLDYVWVVSQTDFSYNRSVVPVAIIETDVQNQIVTIQDPYCAG